MQPAIGAEHGNAFGEGIEGRSLHVGERLVLADQGEFTRNVLEQVDHPALGSGGRRGDIEGAPIGQVPGIELALGREAIGRQVAGAPALIVGFGWQGPRGAQAVENGALVKARA